MPTFTRRRIMKSPPTDEEGAGGGTKSWLSAARDVVIQLSSKTGRRHPNDALLWDVLRAFGGGVEGVAAAAGRDDCDSRCAPGPVNLDPDDGGSTSADVLRGRISVDLLDEVDIDQARMFGRRLASVSALLLHGDGHGHGGGGDDDYYYYYYYDDDDRDATIRRLLRLALHRRAVQILSTTDPILSKRKALRVRSLVDFIWSQSLLLGPKVAAWSDRPTLVDLVNGRDLRSSSTSYYDEFHPGFRRAVIDERTSDYGPVHINVLRIDIVRRSDDTSGNERRWGGERNDRLHPTIVRMRCVDARDTTTDLRLLAERTGAIAAVSGGFFLYLSLIHI